MICGLARAGKKKGTEMTQLNRMESQHVTGMPERAFNSPLLQTRLRIPPLRADLVQRAQLTACLEQAPGRKLLLLSAPAGYGKTTLLSAWAHESSWPVAWLTLDASDNDRTRFLTYLIHALQRIQQQVGKITLDLLTSQQPQSIEMLLVPLLNELLSAPRMVLVLDDYHLIEKQHIHELLLFFLEHLPESLSLIIATRSDPPFPLARLRALHQVRELRTGELRFRREESAAFLTGTMHLPLPEAAIAMLDEHNQGWITGLQLAALSLQGQNQPPLNTLTGIHPFVFDYLAEEVMQHLSASLQTFLLKTSVLTHLHASLCDAVTEQEASQYQLELLERNNLFLTPCDVEHTWYRYHPLFAAFLQKRLSQNAPELVSDLLACASTWCEQHCYLDEAIQYAFAAEHYPRAAYLLARHARTLLEKREVSTLLHWIEKLPDKIIQAQPQLCIAYCWALLFSLQSERIAPFLQQARNVLDTNPGSEDRETQQLRGEVAAIQAMQASLSGELEQALIHSQQALTWLSADDLWTRGTLVFFQGVAWYVTGNMLKARQAYQQALSLNRDAGNQAFLLLALCYLARLSVTAGSLQDARRMLESAREQAERYERHLSFESGLLAIELGNIYYQQNEMDAAYALLTRGIEIGKAMAATGVLRAGYAALARWQQARGRVEEVWSLLWQIDQIKQPATVLWVEAEIRAYRLQWEIMQRPEAALEYKCAEQELEASPMTVLTEISYLAQARVLIASACYAAALSLLEKLLQRAEDERRPGSVICIAVLQSLALAARGERALALAAIQKALVLAAPQRYTRVFLDEGEPMQALLQQAATHSIQSPYALQLLQAFSQADASTSHTQPLLDPLSERELEVLQGIARGQSNQAIADHLYVSLNTVKTHMSHIFAKLHVHSRTQAVARAHELQLIQDK